MKPIWPVRIDIETPEPILDVPASLTQLELGTPMSVISGTDVAEEFAKQRKENLESVARDCITFLKSGISVKDTNMIVYLRRGADYGITKELIASTTDQAAELLARTPSAKTPTTEPPVNQPKHKQSKSKREKS